MSWITIKLKNDNLAIWSTIEDNFIYYNIDEKKYKEIIYEKYRKRAEREIKESLSRLRDKNTDIQYGEFDLETNLRIRESNNDIDETLLLDSSDYK